MVAAASKKVSTGPPSFFTPQSMVTILVPSTKKGKGGQQIQSFAIHKALICYHSPFFTAAFNGKFLEGQTQSMTLDDVDITAFAIFVNWLYTKNITAEIEEHIPPKTLVKLWIMAERFLMPKMQNEIIQKLHMVVMVLGWPTLGDFLTVAWESEVTVLRKLAIDSVLWKPGPEFATIIKDIPLDLVLEVANSLKQKHSQLASYPPTTKRMKKSEIPPTPYSAYAPDFESYLVKIPE